MSDIAPDLLPLSVPISKLKLDPKNARKHKERDLEAIRDSLSRFGQRKPIVVLEDGTVIAGNGTLSAAKELGWTDIAVVRFEDEKRARAYAIADNRTSELSEWDRDILGETLQEIREQDSGLLIGFTEIEVDRILAGDEQIDPMEEWDGMPEFENQDKTAARQIIVNFKTEEDAAKFGELLGQTVTEKTRSLWYPKAEIEGVSDKRYAQGGQE